MSLAAVKAPMAREGVWWWKLLSGAAAFVRIDYVLHKCALGATKAQKLLRRKYLLEFIEVLELDFGLILFLLEYGASGGLTFGVGGFVVAQGTAFEAASFAIYALEFVFHLVVQIKELVRLLGGQVKLFGEPLVLVFAHFSGPGDAVFVGHMLSRSHHGHSNSKDECGY